MPNKDGTGPNQSGRAPGGGGQGGRGGRGRRGGGGPRGRSADCVCPSCGAKAPHKLGVPCATVNCPKCGQAMVRE